MYDRTTRLVVQNQVWTPKKLPGLVAWYSADFGVYSDAGVTPAVDTNLVQQWNDRSGHNYHLSQATSGSRPVFSALGMNSKYPAIRIGNGAVQFMDVTGVVTGTGAAGAMFFMGNILTTSSANARTINYAPAGATDTVTGSMDLGRNSQAIFIGKGTGVSSFGSSQAITYGVNARMGAVADGVATNSTYVNGVAGTVSAGTDAFVSGGKLAIGANITSGVEGSIKWDGTVSEIVFCAGVLSPYDIAKLDYYLARRWT